MLTTVERERGGSPAAIPQSRPLQPLGGAPLTLITPAKLWVAATVLTLIASAVAVSRAGTAAFTLGMGVFGAVGGAQGVDSPEAAQAVVDLEPKLPYGKGMWMWKPEMSNGGDVEAIVNRAKETGLSHIYVRTGSTWDGFYAGPWLDQLLPRAHAAGIRIYGWDFPRLIDPIADAERGLAAIRYRTPDGHKLDGFAADIETQSEGTRVTAAVATAYGDHLRDGIGDGYPLIACVPRPSPWTKSFFPYAEVAHRFDAVAPMVYWLNRQPGPDVLRAIADLKPLGKPIFPVGQAYDGAKEGGRPGVPPPAELNSFMEVARAEGAGGVSFWSWQAADQRAWDTIRDNTHFDGVDGP